MDVTTDSTEWLCPMHVAIHLDSAQVPPPVQPKNSDRWRFQGTRAAALGGNLKHRIQSMKEPESDSPNLAPFQPDFVGFPKGAFDLTSGGLSFARSSAAKLPILVRISGVSHV